MLSARRDSDGLGRRDDAKRLDEAAEFDELHVLHRHNPLTGSAADRAIVVVAGAGVDQRKSSVGRRGVVVLAMSTVFVVFAVVFRAVLVLADFAGRTLEDTVMHMVAIYGTVCVTVQQIAGGPGRQIDDRQQAGCQAISK